MVQDIMELETILHHLKSALVCAFCKSDLKDPVSARCEHSFCNRCASHACKSRLPCPLCNKCSKSRSLKKSSRLQSLLPVVRKLILQSRGIIQLLQDGKNGEGNLKNAVTAINGLSSSNSKNVQATSTDMKQSMKHQMTREKKSPRLYGRLLSVSDSSSSGDFEQLEKRNSILKNESTEQSVEMKVTNWLESSVTESHVMIMQENSSLIHDEQSDMSDDLIAASVGNETTVNRGMNGTCFSETTDAPHRNDSPAQADATSEDLIFPKQKRLKTYGTNNKNNVTYKPPRIHLCNISENSSDMEIGRPALQEPPKQNKTNNLDVETEKSSDTVVESSLVPTILTEIDIFDVRNNDENLSTQELPIINDTVPNNSPTTSNNNSVQCQPYSRAVIIDKLSEKHCGYIDFHNPEGSNIVLQHLENALADLPHDGSLLRWNGKEKAKSISWNNKSSCTRNIVHSSCDEITAINDSRQSSKTPEKRQAQTGVRTMPPKIRKSRLTRSSLNRQTPSWVGTSNSQRASDVTRRQKTQIFSSCVSENGILANENNGRPGLSERSCLSDGKLGTMRSTYSATDLKHLPKWLTTSYVKMVRFDGKLASEKDIETKASSFHSEDKPRSPAKIAKMKGRAVNIDLTQTQQWEQSAAEANDIICCSWNEPEKPTEGSWHEESSVDSKAGSKQPLDCTIDFDAHREFSNNSLIQANCEDDGTFTLPKTCRNKQVIKHIVDALRSVVTIDKDILSNFPISSSHICRAIDSCQNAVTAFQKEVGNQDEIGLNHGDENSTKELENHKSVLENVPDHDGDVAEDSPSLCHNSNVSSSGLSDSAHQSVVPSSVPDCRPNMIEIEPPCDCRVVAKVESWLNRLNDLDENGGKKHGNPSGLCLRSLSNQSISSKRMVSESYSRAIENENLERMNTDALSDTNGSKLDKARRVGSGSRLSTPLTSRTVRSEVDPSPVMGRDHHVTPLGLLTSNLHESDVIRVRTFAKQHNGKFLNTFVSEDVTHVILKAEANRTCNRTLKYLLGIACKKWVVSTKWVVDSLKTGRRLREEDYEIQGDDCVKVDNSETSQLPCGPTKSRLSASDFNLFENCLCICRPPFSLITVEQTKQLLLYCGATVAQHIDEFDASRTKHFQNRLIIVDPEMVADYPGYFLLERQLDATVVGIEWVYETISRFEYQPLDGYCLADFTQDSKVD